MTTSKRMLAWSGSWNLRDVHPRHRDAEQLRRRARAREDEWLRREFVADVDPPSWITEQQWRDRAENEINEYTLPIGYDGTWRSE